MLSQIEADAAKSARCARAATWSWRGRPGWWRRGAGPEAKAPVGGTGLGADAAAADLFAIGFAALKTGNRVGANAALQQMATLAGDATLDQHQDQSITVE